MNYVIVLTYALFLIVTYKIINIKKNKRLNNSNDLFNPKSFFLIFTALELPFAFSVIADHNLIPHYALIHIKDFDYVFFIHFFNSFLFVLAVILSLFIFNPKIGFVGKLFKDENYTKTELFTIHIVLLIITILSFYAFLKTIGGLYYLLQNLDSKSTIIAGSAYIGAIYNTAAFLSVGFLIKSYSLNENISIRKKLYLFVVILSIFLILAAIGSRKIPVLFVLFTMIMWNYNVKKLKILTIKNIFIIIIGLFYFAAMPLFRTKGAGEYYMNNLPILLEYSFNNLMGFFQRFSELDRSLMIYSIFDSSNLWLGSSFIDILYSPIPRGLFPDKPPLDEGVYIYNIAHGHMVEPSIPLRKMIAVGWPTNTITNMYINFWYFGVFFGGIIYGYYFKYFYNLVLYLEYNTISIFLYTTMLFGGFGLTNRNIVAFITSIVFSFLLLKITKITRLFIPITKNHTKEITENKQKITENKIIYILKCHNWK